MKEGKRIITIVDNSGITYQLEEGEIPSISKAKSPNIKFLPNPQALRNFIATLLKVDL